MTNRATCRGLRNSAHFLFVGIVFAVLASRAAVAQTGSSVEDLGSCSLKNHIYTCNSAAFAKALTGAKVIGFETHNADGVARSQLQKFITEKLKKSIAGEGAPPDLIFLLMPTGEAGIIDASAGDIDLGTLRIYSATPSGTRAHLLWAETFTGKPDLPWPAVVRGLILKFQKDFPG